MDDEAVTTEFAARVGRPEPRLDRAQSVGERIEQNAGLLSNLHENIARLIEAVAPVLLPQSPDEAIASSVAARGASSSLADELNQQGDRLMTLSALVEGAYRRVHV